MTVAAQVSVTSGCGQDRAIASQLGSPRREIDRLFEVEPRRCAWAVRGAMRVSGPRPSP
jgi:hypothetical protein